MQNSRFQSITARFRRSSSASSRTSSTTRTSYSSSRAGSPVMTINNIILRQPSLLDLEEERKSFGPELNILEPRPVVYWGSLEERMGSLH